MSLRYLYIIFLLVTLNHAETSGQSAMPDYVYIGETKLYNVDPNPVPGSAYIWRIDGEVQSGFRTNEFYHTWNVAGTFLLEVQEFSLSGCAGPVRSGHVIVTLSLIIPEAFSPNGDLINDEWNIANIGRYPDVEIKYSTDGVRVYGNPDVAMRIHGMGKEMVIICLLTLIFILLICIMIQSQSWEV